MKTTYYQSHVAVKNILQATDNSEKVAAAENYAIEMARYFKAKLTILHIVEIDEAITKHHISLDEYALQHIHQKNHELQEKFSALLIQRKMKAKFVVSMKEESVAKSILEYATVNNSDCIVIGSHGSSGNKNNSFGSVTYDLIKEKSTPLFIIPPQGRFNKFTKVAMACKGNSSEVQLLAWLSKSLDLPIENVNLLHVSIDDNVYQLEQFEQELSTHFSENCSFGSLIK